MLMRQQVPDLGGGSILGNTLERGVGYSLWRYGLLLNTAVVGIY